MSPAVPAGNGRLTVAPRPGAVPDLGRRAGPGIEGELVKRHVEHVGALVEQVLGPVAVVGVPVEHHDALAFSGEQPGGDGNVVEQAEPHRTGTERMVSRRAHGEKSRVALATPQPLDGVGPGTRGPQRRVERAGTGDGVLVEMAAALQAMVLDAVDVRALVDDLELAPGRLTGLERRDQLGCGRGFDACEHRGQPLGALRMPPSGVVGSELLVTSEQAPPFHDGIADGARSRLACGDRIGRGRPRELRLPVSVPRSPSRLASVSHARSED